MSRRALTVTTLNPTYTAEELRHQLQDSGADDHDHGRRCVLAWPARRSRAPRSPRSCRSARPTGPSSLAELYGSADRSGAGRSAEHVVVLPVLVGDHRIVEGGDAHPSQPGGQPRAVSATSPSPTTGEVALAVLPVLPHLRHAGADERCWSRGLHGRSRCPASTSRRRSS